MIQQANASSIRDEMTRAQQLAKNLESRVVELETDKQSSDTIVSDIEKELEELKKFKEEYDIAIEKHKKEMAEIRRRELIAKKLVVDEFKAFEEYKEVVERLLHTLARALTCARSRLIFYFPTSTSVIYISIPISSTEMKTRKKEKMCKMQLFLNNLSHLRVSMYIFLLFLCVMMT